MPTPSSLDQVKELLANGKTEEAANMLLALSKSSCKAHYHSALLLKNRIETLQHNVIDGVLTSNEERIEWARISKAVVELVGQIDKGERPLEKEDLEHTATEEEKPEAKGLKQWIWAAPLLVILVTFGINKFGKNDKPIREASPPAREVLTEAMKEIRGTLITSDNRPVGDVTIIIRSLDGREDIKFSTNARGMFKFEYPENILRKKVKIIFEKNGNVIDTRNVEFLPQKFNIITLQKQD